MLVHLVARTRLGVKVFDDPREAFRLWALLKKGRVDGRTPSRASPTLAACVMPEHLHSIERAAHAGAARRQFARRLSAYSRSAGFGQLWAPLPVAEPIRDRKHLLRQVRYVHLNPCRAGLVSDPLAWPWSTHRGVLGVELEPWVDASAMSAALGRSERGFEAWFHGYVSADPTVAVAGTPPPATALPQATPTTPMAQILEAARAATPYPWQRAVRRQLVVLLCRDQGWDDSALVAAALGISARQVQRLALRRDEALLRLARCFLADARLRFVPGARSTPP